MSEDSHREQTWPPERKTKARNSETLCFPDCRTTFQVLVINWAGPARWDLLSRNADLRSSLRC